MARNSTGRCNMRIEMVIRSKRSLAFAVLMTAAAATSHAAEQPLPPDLPAGTDAQAAHQVRADQARRDWRLDPAIFTDISPVNAPEIAVKLPEDQREEH